MRGFGIDIRGINRKVGSSSNDVGFCSELINLKQDNGVKVVPQKEIVSANIPYKRVSLHRIGKKINYIGVKDDATGVSVVHFDPKSGEAIYTFETFKAGSEICYAFLNNQVVISDKTSVKEYVYSYENEYKLTYNGLDFPIYSDLKPEYKDSDVLYEEKKQIFVRTKEELYSSLNAEVKKFKVDNKNYCEGVFMYGFTLTLKDGTETGMYNFSSAATPLVRDGVSLPSADAFIDVTYANKDPEPITLNANIYFWRFFQQFKLKVTNNYSIVDGFKDLVSKVNLYVSVPKPRIILNDESIKYNVNWEWISSYPQQFTEQTFTVNNIFNVKESGIEKELLYKQKSWSLEEFSKGFEYTLEFGGDVQTTGATMEVYATNADRSGKMYTYNNRVHFFDSVVRLKPSLGDLYNKSSKDSVYADVYVYIKTQNKENVLKYENVKVGTTDGEVLLFPKLNLPEMTIFPDSRAYKMMFVFKDDSIEGFVGKKQIINLTPSPAYNYAYYFGGEDATEGTTPFDGTLPTLSDTYEETEVINVSAGGNPMVFPVAHSYKFKGNITAVSVATDAISDVQVGQYPLTVFTDNGIFALEQGNGEVLYSNIVPISNDVCVNDSVLPIRQGIAYIAHNSLWVLSGRNSTKMSELLEGNVDTNIQNNESFTKCCCGNLYNISQSLSQVDFRTFVKDANLSWSPTSNEIIVSNKAYNYSYVYDFINNSWYKVSGAYEMIEDNMVLQPVSVNTSSATPSTGTVTLSAIHKESSRSFPSICYANYDQNKSCSPGNTIALVIDGTQVASATFSQLTKMNMIVATLCEKVSYLEDTKGVIYSRTELSGKVVKIYNITTAEDLITSTFVSSVQSVTIPNKAINSVISINLNQETHTTRVTENSSVITILNDLATNINANSKLVTASVIGNKLSLTSIEVGAYANNISLDAWSGDPDYIYITTSGYALSGGKDISLVPSQYKQIVDWVDEVKGKEQTIHLHTRPLHLGNNNTYKTIKRTALNCLADLKGNQNLSMYIFASDNLTTFKCVCAAQRKDCTVSQIIADRSAKAYKYFVFMIGGIVTDTTQIHNIITSVEDIADKKIR